MNLNTNYVTVTHVTAENLTQRLRKVRKVIKPVNIDHLDTTASVRQIINTVGQQHNDGLRGLFDGQRKHIQGKDSKGRAFIITFHGEQDDTYRYELILVDAFDLKTPEELNANRKLAVKYGLHGQDARERALGLNQQDSEALAEAALLQVGLEKPPFETTSMAGSPSIAQVVSEPSEFQYLQSGQVPLRNPTLERAGADVQVFSKALADNLSTRTFDFSGEQAQNHWHALAMILKNCAAQEPQNVVHILVQGLKDAGLEAYVEKALLYYGDKAGMFSTNDILDGAVELVQFLYNEDHNSEEDNGATVPDSAYKLVPTNLPKALTPKPHPIFTFNYDATLAELRQLQARGQNKVFAPSEDWISFLKRHGLSDHAAMVIRADFFADPDLPGADATETVVYSMRRALLVTYINELDQDPVLTGQFAMDEKAIKVVRTELMNLFSGNKIGLEIAHPQGEKVLNYLFPVHCHLDAHRKARSNYRPTFKTLTPPIPQETTMNQVTLTKAPRCDVIIPEVTEMTLANLEPFGLSEHKDLVETYYRAALQAPNQEQAKMEIDALCNEFMDIGYENIEPFRFESYAMLQAVGKVFGEKPVNHPDTTHEAVAVEDRAIQGRTDVLDFFDMRKALFLERYWSLGRNKPKNNPEKFQIPAAIRERFPVLDLSKDEQRVALMHHYAAEVYSGEGGFDAACNYAGTDDAGHKYHISNGIQDVQLVVIWGNRITDYTLARKSA